MGRRNTVGIQVRHAEWSLIQFKKIYWKPVFKAMYFGNTFLNFEVS